MKAHSHQPIAVDIRYLREALRLLAQQFIELEASAVIEASHYERIESRRNYRNGYRQRTWHTTLGEITLYIPKLRRGTFYPAFLEALRHAEPDLLKLAQAAVQQEVSVFEMIEVARGLRLSVQPAQLAELEEQLHDLAHRGRAQSSRFENPSLNSSAPLSAISTISVTDDLPNHLGQGTQSVLDLLVSMQLDYSTEWLAALLRVHHALTNPADAVARAA